MVESVKELWKICKKPKWAHRGVHKVAIYVTKVLLHTNITANQITFLGMIIGLVGGLFFAMGQYIYSFVAALSLYLWKLMDAVDGQIARYRKTISITGAYMDVLNHIIITQVFFIGISFGIYRMYHNYIVFIFGYLASFSIILLDYVTNLKYTMVAHIYEVFQHQQSTKSIKEVFKNIKPVNPDIKNTATPTITHISELLFYTFRFPKFFHIILLATIVDLIVSYAMPNILFSSLYAVLIVYGTVVPILWIGLAYTNVKNRLPDGLYYKLFLSKLGE